MDFNQLLAKMKTLDTATNEGCGEMSAMPSTQSQSTETQPPSMTVNLNAQGMNDIESVMKLFQKVNPDMMPKDPVPMPSVSEPPTVMSISPDSKPINKLLPDLSDEPAASVPNHMALKKKEHEEAYVNEPDEQEYDMDKIIANGNDLHKQKNTYPKVAGGDNPMQRVSEASSEARDYIRDVRDQIDSGEVDPEELEKEFFDTLSFYDMNDAAIARAWERITTGDNLGLVKKPKDDVKDLFNLKHADDDEVDLDLDDLGRKARSGGIQTGWHGAERESREDFRAKIREELQHRLNLIKSKK